MNFLDILPDLLILILAVVMLGLGLELSLADFARVTRNRKPVTLALGLQVIVLPLAAFALAIGFALPAAFAVGVMILAASPGGVTANLFSHLYGGRVAMNLTLTALNTLLAIATLPLIANLAIGYFAPEGSAYAVVPLQFGKVAQVVAVIFIPVSIGMVLRHRAPGFAARSQRPFKILSALVLAGFALAAIISEWDVLVDSLATLGPAVVVFNLLSLLAGYTLARFSSVEEGDARAISFEIGIHNTTLALYIALSILRDLQVALPAALYSVSMYVTAVAFGMWLSRNR
jgi:BASS family bile acid:Na+ symporter